MRCAHLQTGGTFFAAHWGSLATSSVFASRRGAQRLEQALRDRFGAPNESAMLASRDPALMPHWIGGF
jgi:hypothetical protein